jgi:hypothetical protein
MPERKGAFRVGRRLVFEESMPIRKFHFKWDSATDLDLVLFKKKYGLERLKDRGGSTYGTLKNCLRWAHGRLGQSSYGRLSAMEKHDASAKKLRCVEYSLILRTCLAALGIKARRLALKTKDVETRKDNAGHIAVEAYLPEYGKWAFADPQWGAIPILGGTPLNAVELQAAISEKKNVKFWNLGSGDSAKYLKRIYQYLFYFDVRLDNRTRRRSRTRLMLVPFGAKRPKVFQRTLPLKDTEYTGSARAFYARP